MKRLFCVILLVSFAVLGCVLAASDGEEQITVEAYFNIETITIGEKVNYIIRIEMPRDTKLDLPVVDAVLVKAGFAVRDFGEEEAKKITKNRIRNEYWYKLETYVTGSYVVPSVVIGYTLPDGTTENIATEETFLEVKSVISAGDEASDIRDIKFPVSIKVSYKKLIVWSLIVLLLIIFFAAGVPLLWKHRKKLIKTTPSLPPYVVALQELERTKEMKLDNDVQVKEYYIRISGIVRRYVENYFGICAPERTTEEFLQELTTEAQFHRDHKKLLKEFLRHCDMVKFAKYNPDSEEIEGVYSKAKQFVEETKEKENNLESQKTI